MSYVICHGTNDYGEEMNSKKKKYFYSGRRLAIEVRTEEEVKEILAFKARLVTEGKSLTQMFLQFIREYMSK